MTNLAQPAQYLLRIDDLCFTVHTARWKRLRALIDEFGIRPILAIVPANRDRELEISPHDPNFWRDIRIMQTAGSTVALHGLTHLCSMRSKSLVPLHPTSEFAGFDRDVQLHRIARGLAILRSHSLDPKLFVAPGHTFDRNTLLALREQGIGFLSDGFARRPYVRFGVTWIPMQLWSPVPRPHGLWTICIHPNTMDDAAFGDLRRFLMQYADQFTSFDRVVREHAPTRLSAFERAGELIEIARVRLRHARQLRRHPEPSRASSGRLHSAADSD